MVGCTYIGFLRHGSSVSAGAGRARGVDPCWSRCESSGMTHPCVLKMPAPYPTAVDAVEGARGSPEVRRCSEGIVQ